jgi:hypothetical protein
VADLREKILVIERPMQKYDLKRFDLRKPNDIEAKEK